MRYKVIITFLFLFNVRKNKKGEKKLRCKLEYSKQESLNFEIKSIFNFVSHDGKKLPEFLITNCL